YDFSDVRRLGASDHVFGPAAIGAHEQGALTWSPERQGLARRRVGVQEAHALRRFHVEVPPRAARELERRLVSRPSKHDTLEILPGWANQEVGPKPRVSDAAIGGREESAELCIGDMPVEVDVCSAAQRRAELMTQDAPLIAFPLVAVAVRRRRQNEAGVVEAGWDAFDDLRASVSRPTPPRTSIEHQKVGLARVDEDVVGRGRGAGEQVEMLAALQVLIFEHHVAFTFDDIAVPAVEEVKFGYLAALASRAHFRRKFAEDAF